MDKFTREIALPVDSSEAFAWHERPGALDRLIPPWENVQVVHRAPGLDVGSRVELVQKMGLLRLKWIAEHTEYEPCDHFRDHQKSGPFTYWDHVHRFENRDDGCVLRDEVTYAAPGGAIGRWIAGSFVREKIAQMFAFRQRTTEADLAAQKKYGESVMHIAITGAGGLVGSELAPLLTTGGHEVTRLVRRTPGEGEARWDPDSESFDAAALDGVDGIVHLAGENIAAGRWNAKKKARIRDSRVKGTRILCEGLAKLANPPKVLVCASAIGFYGDRGDAVMDEQQEPGEGFLADVVSEWEAATQPARDAGIRVVNLRFGMVLSPKDGALAKMLTPFKLGGGGIVGSGKQYWSWISVDDAAGAILHSLMTEQLAGPVNAVAPDQTTNFEFTKVLGRVLRRPTILPVPAFAAKLALGEMAEALLLPSARVVPRKLNDTGYEFRHPKLEDALRHLLGRNET